MTQHTPGPWSFFQQGDEYGLWGGPAARDRVFSIKVGVIPQNADARLIAVAPKMRALLRRLVAVDANPAAGSLDVTYIADEARALLAKIEGERP